MANTKNEPHISQAALARIPRYLLYLHKKRDQGERYVSSTEISQDLNRNPVQVRKDLALISKVSGKPKLGFDVGELIDAIEGFLGYRRQSEAVIAGVGQLGKTLLSYPGFSDYGLKITAGFDLNPKLAGTTHNGKPIYDIADLSDYVKQHKTVFGVITVPAAAAQTVADLMTGAGIRAIWNFAPVHLSLPDGVALKNENMAASLAMLSLRLRALEGDDPQ